MPAPAQQPGTPGQQQGAPAQQQGAPAQQQGAVGFLMRILPFATVAFAALVPLALMVPLAIHAGIAYAAGAQGWPLLLILASPVTFTYLVLVGIAKSSAGRREREKPADGLG